MKNNARILVVDDEDDLREIFVKMLQSKDYYVSAVENGELALKLAAKERFDMIILDLNMSGMNGIDTYRAIKHIDQKVKVLMITGVFLRSLEDEAIKLGICGFLHKPFCFNDLLSKVKGILN